MPRYGFQIPLDVRYLPNGRWQILKDIRYLSALTHKAYTVEAGFEFDFASVPRLPFVYWLTGNTAQLASVVHDYLYAHPEIEPKATADDIFAEIMDAKFYESAYDGRSAEPEWRKALMYSGVAAFGADHYRGPSGEPVAGFAMGD